MKKLFKYFIIFVSVLLITNNISFAASAKQPLTPAEKRASLSKLTGSYYKNRDTLQVPIILQYVSDLNALEKKNYNSQITGFLVGVIHQGNRKQVAEWKKLPISDLTKNALTRAVIIEPSIEKMLNDKNIAPDVGSVDFYWGYFGATYDKRCIQIIINTMNDKKANPMARTAAQWSLNANRSKYKVVDDMLREQTAN